MEEAQNDDSAPSTYNAPNPAALPPTDSPSSISSGKKRRASTLTSRGVANLTPEQLAKKRANDREAQRAIRERTKNQLETLERRIEQLTAQQPYQDLQHVVRQKEVVEAENEEIKRRLSSVLAILQPILGGCALGDPLPAPYGNDLQGRQPVDSVRGTPLHNSDSLPQVPSPFPEGRPGTSSGASSSSRTMLSRQGYWQAPSILSHAAPISHTAGFLPVNALDRPRDNLAQSPDISVAGEKLGLNYLLDPRQHTLDVRSHPFGRGGPALPADSHITLSTSRTPINLHSERIRETLHTPPQAFSTPVQNIPPTCPLDGLLLKFLVERRRQAAEGKPTHTLIGPPYPSFSSLLNPQRPSHNLSKLFTDLLGTFPDLATLPEQVAVLLIMFLVMRWQIDPTKENYDRLPDWMTPRPSQLITPHPAWADHLPWPRMRDRIIEDYVHYPFDNFFVSYTKTLSLNWPYDPRDTLLSTSPGSDDWVINPAFESHLMQLGNWSLGPAFAEVMPVLGKTARIKEDEGGRRRRSS